MDSSPIDAVLDAKLEPLAAFMKRRGLVELNANSPGRIMLEFPDGRRVEEKAPALTAHYWIGLCYILANSAGQVFDPETVPFVSTRLPGGHRFEAMTGPFCETGLSVSIRMFREIERTPDDFGLTGEWKERVTSAVRLGHTIFISGGTSSGKTTLLNTLIPFIPAEKRILTVEDTRELRVSHLDRNHFVPPRHSAADTPAAVDYSKIIDHLMRSRPDIVIAGELSIRNTFPSLRLLNTGHRGFMCTVHANSARLALEEAVAFNCNLAGYRVVDLARYMLRTVDLVIQVMKVGSGLRRVTEIWEPSKGGDPVKIYDGILEHV
jgi:type IV secretory pathway ATPase VirB11/archaellum biosynthesis ATPase